MKKLFTKFDSNIINIYSILLCLNIVSICIYLCINPKSNTFSEKSSTVFSTGWYDSQDNEIILKPLINNKTKFKKHKNTTIYHKIDSSVNVGDSLCFRAQNTVVNGYIGKKQIFKNKIKKDAFSCNSSGTDWHFYQFTEDDIGKTIELKLSICYDDSSCCISLLKVMPEKKYILEYFYTQLLPLFSFMFTFVFSIVFLIYGFYLKHYGNKTNHIFKHLGYFSFLLSLWSLLETHTIEFFIDASPFLQFLNNIILYFLIIPGITALKSIFNIKNEKVCNKLCTVSLSSTLVALILHFSNIADVHTTLLLCHLTIGFCAISLVIIVLIEKSKARQKHETQKNITQTNLQTNILTNKKSKLIRIIAVSILSLAILVDIIYYYLGISSTNGSFMRMCITALIVYCAYLSLEHFLNIHSELERSTFVKQLAYQDGLTNIKNRTAFQEKIDELQQNLELNPRLAIVMIDLNNLKIVNDNFGHSTGDEFIMTAVEIIKNTFGDNCEHYRIGGDEFAIIINAPNPEAIYKISSIQLKANIQNYNNFYGKNYKISMACGVGFYNRNTATTHNLQEIINLADQEMYNDKNASKKAKALYNNLDGKTIRY